MSVNNVHIRPYLLAGMVLAITVIPSSKTSRSSMPSMTDWADSDVGINFSNVADSS